MSKSVDKVEISRRIVAEIMQKGGRFLKRSLVKEINGKCTFWFDIGEKAAREKTCQALREHGPLKVELMIPSKKKVVGKVSEGGGAAVPNSPITSNNSIDVAVVNDNDILLGRGGVTNSHVGNRKYLEMVRQNQSTYLAARKLEKSTIAMTIVNTIASTGGRFLQLQGSDWVEVAPERAREKTSQALREKGPDKRKVHAAHTGPSNSTRNNLNDMSQRIKQMGMQVDRTPQDSSRISISSYMFGEN